MQTNNLKKSGAFRGRMLLAALSLASAFLPAMAAWEGKYDSKARNEQVQVRATLPTEKDGVGEWRFENLACSVGLKATTNPSQYKVVLMSNDRDSGEYCSAFPGGTLSWITKPDFVQTELKSRSGKASIEVKLRKTQ